MVRPKLTKKEKREKRNKMFKQLEMIEKNPLLFGQILKSVIK